VRIGERTYVTWLDALSAVRIRSFDHGSGEWSETHSIDDGFDNHCSPALSATPDGRLRIAYGPHGYRKGGWNCGRFKLIESAEPGSTSEWARLSDVGYGGTYASLATDSQGNDHLVYRGGPMPWSNLYERRRPNNAWDRLSVLARQSVDPGYVGYGSQLVIGPRDALYCGFSYYSAQLGRSAGACVVRSGDGGETWLGLDGRPVRLPLEYDPRFAPPHEGEGLSVCALSVREQGEVFVLTKETRSEMEVASVAIHRKGQWSTTSLESTLPEDWGFIDGALTVDARGRVLVAATLGNRRAIGGSSSWSHPSLECFLLASDDGGRSFETTQISRTSNDFPNWLPNISNVGPNHDLSRPLIIYTHGSAGDETNLSREETEVYAVWVD